MKDKWNTLDIKNKIAYITAISALLVGFGLTIAGFIAPPVGLVADSVLWILGQTLVYAGSIFGVGMYVGSSVKGMKKEIEEYLRKD